MAVSRRGPAFRCRPRIRTRCCAAIRRWSRIRASGSAPHSLRGLADSPYAWCRLTVALLLSTIGGVGMWSVVVALPSVQAEFGVARGDASLPYALTMIGFGVSSILMGRLADRFS